MIERVILFPFIYFVLVFVLPLFFFIILNFYLFEKHHFILSSCNQNFIIDKIHLPKVLADYLLKFIATHIFILMVMVDIYCKRLALSIEAIHLFSFLIIKIFVRKVQFCCVHKISHLITHLDTNWVSNLMVLLNIIN